MKTSKSGTGRANRRRTLCAMALLACLPAFHPVQAQTLPYPSRPIRMVVPAPAGGGTDTMARLVANKLAEATNWQMVVDNRPGAGGNIGLDAVAKAPADGYTIAMGESSNLTINPYLYPSLPFDVEKDLAPVILVAKVPLVLVVASGGKFDSVPNLVRAAQQKPLTFASSGNGTVGHLAGEIWKRKLGVDLVHVPYRGAAPALTEVIGGQVDMFFASLTTAMPFVGSGRLKALAVTSYSRARLLPDVPSMAELGYRDFDSHVIFGVVTTAGTPAPIVSRLNTEIGRVLSTPSVLDAMASFGADRAVQGGTPAQFKLFLWQERQKWSRVVKESGAKVD